jgi:REP element-mobilizing transposase RayT
MARQERQVHPGHLTEITIKTFQARFLLAPNRRVNSLFLGVLAMAQQRYGMTLCGVVVMSNHAHLLVVPESGRQLKQFCQFLNSNVSTEIGRLRRWPGGIFRRRYEDVVITHEEAAQVGRLRYILSHGVKESLVRRPQDWPGVHCARALLRGHLKMVGKWVDRTALYEAQRRAKAEQRHGLDRKPCEGDFTSSQTVTFSKLPCWDHLSDAAYFQEIRNLVAEIVEDHAANRARVPDGAPRRLTCQDPEHRPTKTKKSPKPICHAASRDERCYFRELRRDWIRQYRQATAMLREGRLDALGLFPPEAFLPRMSRDLAMSAYEASR